MILKKLQCLWPFAKKNQTPKLSISKRALDLLETIKRYHFSTAADYADLKNWGINHTLSRLGELVAADLIDAVPVSTGKYTTNHYKISNKGIEFLNPKKDDN